MSRTQFYIFVDKKYGTVEMLERRIACCSSEIASKPFEFI